MSGRAWPNLTSEPVPDETDRWPCDATGELRAYLERRLHARGAANAVLSETMGRVARRAHELPSDPDRRRMWLFTIAANVLADQRHIATRTCAGGADAIKDALRLHHAQRELLMLIERSGVGIVEAARLLGLEDPTGGSSYAAAREHLRQSLDRAAGR